MVGIEESKLQLPNLLYKISDSLNPFDFFFLTPQLKPQICTGMTYTALYFTSLISHHFSICIKHSKHIKRLVHPREQLDVSC